MKVHDNNGFSTDPDFVLNRWKDYFNSLYNPPEEGLHYDEEIYSDVMRRRHQYEINATETSDLVNSDTSYDEIDKLGYWLYSKWECYYLFCCHDALCMQLSV